MPYAEEPAPPLRDSALPTLEDALDRDAVLRGFAQVWRRAEPESVRVSLGQRVDTKYTPALGCVVTYTVSLESGDGEPRPSIGVVEIDTSGTAHRRFLDDPALPGLTAAADGDAMYDRVSLLSRRGLSLTSKCGVAPVRYKPGRSCVLRYGPATPGTTRAMFGKMWASDASGHAAALSALSEASARSADMPRILEPIAFWPDLGLVVQWAASGIDLTRATMGRSTAAWDGSQRMRDAGRALAALHTTVACGGPTIAWEQDLEELAAYRALFVHLTPGLAGPFDELVVRLRKQAQVLWEPTRVASHGALRTDQFLVDADGRLILLDLDGFCWANPARDLANMLAYLAWRAIRRPEDAGLVDALSRAVLDGYATLAPVPDERWLRAYRAATMLKIAGRRLRRLAFDEWPALTELIDCAQSALVLTR